MKAIARKNYIEKKSSKYILMKNYFSHPFLSIHHKRTHRDSENSIFNDAASFNISKLWLEILKGFENINKYPSEE